MPYLDGRNVRRGLAHELMHNCVVHLRLPVWLNEGLAVVFDRTVAQGRQPILDADLRDRHLAFWNPEKIQKFWAGVSFGRRGIPMNSATAWQKSSSTSCSASPGTLGSSPTTPIGVRRQTAALDVLGIDLGEIATIFLGEEWCPSRKAMVECWEATKDREEGGRYRLRRRRGSGR